ncbi:L-aspartate oxidase [Corynebacterium timonense]|uniref:L-aspartate oxidase n=1 Tax=Corynebacterium timonense TaxID=441500 RepID=A0A1H1PU29_9CORY|nr:FAD-binding protein [Corynebacterium timonense]SDS14634.1 L-aspartate oxidase [Corynebacterium timonense]
MRHVVVVGAGVAGLSAACAAAREAEVTLVYPGEDIASSPGSTQLAQGGIAAAIGPSDTPEAHARDTIEAGAGLVDTHAATYLAERGARQVRALLGDGFPADPGFGLEGAHSAPRITHAGGDRTGAELHRFLITRALSTPRIHHAPRSKELSLSRVDGHITGLTTLSADAVILATGGYCGVYPLSTGAPEATGAGIVAAARAGALLADMEFVQFHPTVLEGTGALISEAVRGAGAHLINGHGTRFLLEVDPRGELAPRDVVSAGVHRERQTDTGTGTGAVYLDARHVDDLSRRFPGISARLAQAGLDWTRELVPVAPAAHYSMGGIVTDLAGRTSVPGLYAVGEVARTGVHGANRLASNSLLEGLVFGAAAGRAAAAGEPWHAPEIAGEVLDVALPDPNRRGDAGAAREAIGAGLAVERTGETITGTARALRGNGSIAAATGLLMAAAAAHRTESRGAHRRLDHPDTDPAQARPIYLRAV